MQKSGYMLGWLLLMLVPTLCHGSSGQRTSLPDNAAHEQAVTVDVHLNKPGPPALATGFLHGPAPALDSKAGQLVQALHPKLWRTGLHNRETLRRARHYGAQPMAVVSDSWGYPGHGNGWPGNPFAMQHKWHDFVVRKAELQPNRHWIWDIWNEPDLSGFYNDAPQQFYTVFSTADRILHNIRGPKVQVAGPGFAHFDLGKLTRFAKAMMQAGVKLEVLAWHENGVHGVDAVTITKHLKQARRQFIDDPEFAALGVKKLMITEYGQPQDYLKPAAIVAWREALEDGRADAASRSCWKRSILLRKSQPLVAILHAVTGNDKSTCRNGSMDGLITAASQPRAAWWAERALVPQGNYRVASNAPPGWSSVASRHSLVIGRFQGDKTRLRVRFHGLGNNDGRLRVCARLIPNSGTQPVPKLAALQCKTAAIDKGQAQFTWQAPAPGAALWLSYNTL